MRPKSTRPHSIVHTIKANQTQMKNQFSSINFYVALSPSPSSQQRTCESVSLTTTPTPTPTTPLLPLRVPLLRHNAMPRPLPSPYFLIYTLLNVPANLYILEYTPPPPKSSCPLQISVLYVAPDRGTDRADALVLLVLAMPRGCIG